MKRKIKKIFSLLALICILNNVTAQEVTRIVTRTGIINPIANHGIFTSEQWAEIPEWDGYKYMIIQFSQLPNSVAKSELGKNGIELLNYLPQNNFYARVNASYAVNRFQGFAIRSVYDLQASDKIDQRIKNNDPPSYAVKDSSYQLMVTLHPGIDGDKFVQQLKEKGASILNSYNHQHIALEMNKDRIADIAGLAMVQFIDFINAPMQKENILNKTDHRSNALNTDYGAGRHYDGSGVRIAITDDGFIGPHIDYQGRTTQDAVINVNDGDHGDHCAGTIMSAGNLDPLGRGMAPGSDLWVYEAISSNNYILSDTLYTSPSTSIDIVSTSYSDGCNVGYNAGAESADRQIRMYPHIMRFFSAGNTGTNDCSYGAGNGWGNITGGIKMAKNLIAVANLSNLDVAAPSSSRGPASDGRLKPDVSGVGTAVYSTIDTNDYALKSGTSMSCPGAAGLFAQLYQAYRQLNNNQDPNTSILKNILMNSCDDIGNPGPDFIHGYGRINGLRAVKLLENNQFILDSVDHAATKTFAISVPPNTQQVKIMLNWHDYEASIAATTDLVNDLDLRVINPSIDTILPWVLNSTPNATSLNANATQMADHLNNAEQVTINNPIAGNYTIQISGFNVPMGTQWFSISYEFIANDSLEIVYPIGAEGFVPGQTETLRWDALDNGNTYDLEYTVNNGNTWNSIANNINSSQKYYQWQVPNTLSGNCKVRVSRNGIQSTSPSSFSIMNVPTGLAIVSVCPDTITIKWDSTAGASSYQVFLLGTKYMDSIGSTSNTFMKIAGLNILTEHWFSVKAVNASNNAISRRAFAINQKSGLMNCLNIQNDAQASTGGSPSNATILDCNAGATLPVIFKIRNNGSNTLSNFPVHYQVNNLAVVTENFTGSILPGITATYTFTTAISNLPAGSNTIKMWTALPGDVFLNNDTITISLILMNGVLASLPWKENFETQTLCPTVNACDQTDCVLQNNMTNEQNFIIDDFDWKVFASATPTSNTGPDVDHTLNTISGKYIYIESSYCYQKSAYLLTPCFDFQNVTKPFLNYWYHLYGNGQGSLHVDANVNGTWQLDIMNPIVGDQGNAWLQRSHDLSAFKGKKVYFRFRGLTGINQRSDMALDDIGLVDSLNNVESISEQDQMVSIHPIPANDYLQFDFKNSPGNVQIEIYTPLGEIIYKKDKINSSSISIDVTHFSSGIYYTLITNSNGDHFVKKIIINH